MRRAAPLAAISIVFSACAPETKPAAPQEPPTSLSKAEAGPAPMVRATDATAAAPDAPTGLAAAGARRCGWLQNPTPANWWLTDREGQWILAVQGGYQAPGMEEMPDMSGAGWEEVNGHYGYGCACMILTVDPRDRRVLRIAEPSPRPLKQCRDDRTLPRP